MFAHPQHQVNICCSNGWRHSSNRVVVVVGCPFHLFHLLVCVAFIFLLTPAKPHRPCPQVVLFSLNDKWTTTRFNSFHYLRNLPPSTPFSRNASSLSADNNSTSAYEHTWESPTTNDPLPTNPSSRHRGVVQCFRVRKIRVVGADREKETLESRDRIIFFRTHFAGVWQTDGQD